MLVNVSTSPISIFVLDQHLEEVRAVRTDFLEFLASLGVEDKEQQGWKLVFTELANNAICHGSKANPDAKVTIRWWNDANTIWLEIEDCGSGPPPERIKDPKLPDDPMSESGRGLFIARSFLDAMEGWRSPDGFILRCKKSYSYLNNILPNNPEMELILDELSDCYENLTLFYRLADTLVEGTQFSKFLTTAVNLFIEAGGYELIHLEEIPGGDLLELSAIASDVHFSTLGKATPALWKHLHENPNFVWMHEKGDFPFVGKYRDPLNGCVVPVMHRTTLVALLAIGMRANENPPLARDIRNLKSLAEIIGIALSRSITDREQQEKRRISHELKIATSLQKELLTPGTPAQQIEGYDVLLKSAAAMEVAGDFCEVRKSPDGSYVCCIIDVMGKGITAAILAGIFRSHFLRFSLGTDSPGAFVGKLNKALVMQLSGRTMFITAVVCRIYPQTGVVHYAGAGHPPALMIRGQDPIVQLPSSGPPIGLFADIAYANEQIILEKGDRFILLTDGLFEWTAGYGVFGWDALVDWLSLVRDCDGEQIWRDLIDNIGEAQSVFGKEQEDDETLMIITRKTDEENTSG